MPFERSGAPEQCESLRGIVAEDGTAFLLRCPVNVLSAHMDSSHACLYKARFGCDFMDLDGSGGRI
jgi:hypothetical protein